MPSLWRFLPGWLHRTHRQVRSFEQAIRDAGGVASVVDRGMAAIPVEKIVGSVSRSQNLRSDFFYRTGQAVTQRFYRIGQAMAEGKLMPPLELYKLRPRQSAAARDPPPSEYYVVDGHHRVAMARKMGQDFLDAHVTEYAGSSVPPVARVTHSSLTAEPTRRMLISAILHHGGSEAQLAHTLRRVALFREAPAHDLVAVWRHLIEVRAPAGATICKRGEVGDRFYIVQAGSVEVRLGAGNAGVSLYRLAPGDCFGEMSLLIGGTRSADVVAVEDTVLWALERSDFDHVLTESVSLLRALNRSLAHRLAMATSVIEQAELAGPRAGLAGLRFGPYRVLAQLGAGGMAVVYSAAREDGAVIALKVLPASWGDAPDLRARLEREASTLRRVQHPGVVRLLDVGAVAERVGGGTYIAMEWLPDALDRVLQAQFPDRLPVSSALRIARDVAEALGAVHAAGLIHRDVKPSNILLREDGQPVVTDFGLAAAITDSSIERRLTPANILVGTADYLAPEVIDGHAVDGRADLYALGVILYEMLAGFVPFAGRDPLQTLRAQREEAVPLMPSSVPTFVQVIVERALQKQPQDRFSSAHEMAEALDVALRSLT